MSQKIIMVKWNSHTFSNPTHLKKKPFQKFSFDKMTAWQPSLLMDLIEIGKRPSTNCPSYPVKVLSC
jgi:hypothetical protein